MGREIGVKQSREMDLHTGGELGQLEGAGPPIPRTQERDEGRQGSLEAWGRWQKGFYF